ncbi:D-glycero-beta-D-manno-heptose-1,7-bisphosphate 7-phosphatase [Candidatus Arsenophonus lipoptenae]|uniref:D,D-heptose 1,7-bisphosphate phosphatase n=1 Tax=Candidatus Arsenophonus lipoptenae TaxID=634113 RepID=A0A0X9VIZ8_9GAMM|nr:D-glycero-beta-D-manno-heptose 1,7-bisphosphate 7-phosphatase [Candidatus Arsenophonus lipoptenae]AMA64960.1 D-glycero-beta-D-manno-heptose-1,7-bisphosphate 7-phosphatase [Candidatus Arsenophonus lipoptenae]
MNLNISAIFLDRDGIINYDYGYVYEKDTFQFIEGSVEALQELKTMNYVLVIVTNQSGIAKGLFTETQFIDLTNWMYRELIQYGIKIDGIYYCPHHPNAIKMKYKQICNCRKPKAGWLFTAQKKMNINMKTSYMVGDKLSDMKAGKNAGIGTTVLVSVNNSIMDYDKKYVDWIINSLAELPYRIKKYQSVNNILLK